MYNRKYCFAGLGLMGGSFALALRKILADRYDFNIFAIDSSREALKDAEERGVIDEAYLPEQATAALKNSDFVFVCLYPAKTIQFLKDHRDNFKSGAVVTDITGIKAGLAANLPALLRNDVDFIIGHPMAGSEKEGFSNANASIFEGRNYILMPQPFNKKENLVFFKNLMHKIGFARITETDFLTHDKKIAFTSQLCHVIAAALVESAPDNNITAFGGGSFEDLTRIAVINAPLWTELFLDNKKNLLEHIDSFESVLQKLKKYIIEDKAADMTAFLNNVRVKRSAMNR